MHCFWISPLLHVVIIWISEESEALSLKDSRERMDEHPQEEVAQWWGEWSSWSTCTWACGGGVSSQERHCLQQRLTTTHNVNSSFCTGSTRRFQLCTQQPCPNNRISFKQHQCSQFNSKPFNRKHYEWVPLYPDDDISISSKPCDLQCTTTGGERQVLLQARDGTSCRTGAYKGVCIEGQCQVVGCDGKLYSSKSEDKCGVCAGHGDTCSRVSGSYRKGITQLGYAFVTHVPAGATDIQIIERRKTENILALSDEAGRFFFNGNAVIDNPRNFHVAGTMFKYRRPLTLFTDGFEYIMAQGPTQHGLNVMYYNLNGKVPHITYEYTVPRPAGTAPPAPASLAPEVPRLSSSLSSDGNEVDPRQEGAEEVRSTSSAPEENLEGRGGPPRNLTEDPEVLRFGSGGDVLRNDLEEQESFGPDVVLMEGDAPGVGNGTRPSVQNPARGVRPDSSSSVMKILPLRIHASTHRERGSNRTSESAAWAFRLQQGAAGRLAQSESNEFELVSLERNVSLGDTYGWKVSELAPCSSTCTTGISTSHALCVRYDGLEVDESYCDALTRPEPTHQFCTGKECPPRWETSRWSECSRTCGEGVQFRAVRCWKMMAPGFDSSVYDDLCHAVELHAPVARKSCRSRSCGPQWEMSDWSECSAQCGRQGVRNREVRCSMDARLCNGSTRPSGQRECEGPPCDRRWSVSDWGPCSGGCGTGRMRRHVACRSGSGHVAADAQCDRELRPRAVQPCGDPDCPARWVEQDWEQCNTTCGRGMKSRLVTCAGLEGGVFKEFPDHACSRSAKPEESATCFERPCSKWFTTSWSQCSKTCGSGLKVREVKCYQGDEIGQSCDSALRPATRQSCEVQTCPTEAPVEDECEDKATANCALVLKVKLCTHWYYRKACCQSCRER